MHRTEHVGSHGDEGYAASPRATPAVTIRSGRVLLLGHGDHPSSEAILTDQESAVPFRE
jgi:hypothetical protein